MPYRYVEDISMADVAFVASGSTLEEMFVSAGLATTNVMVKNIKKIKKKIIKKISLESDSIEKLLHSFLQEFVFWKDRSMLIFSHINVKISQEKDKFILKAILGGEKLDSKKHEMLVDVKAVTWHKFYVEKKGRIWECGAVLDI